ncbi:hypothetical protein COCC4DRAFT_82396 [Bipolaris maydis ATCC 48331]|uniref:Uncharacterized protein n=2 Tax=Cochliobolus heterostrophus TaxID=5016 RepID=M2UTH2_COCH5|nr:uncharacterized protein COCC4DRAFT_82396 [Bipolaris maydis ATCC 48331]EMD96851.1 hypothetical protein COCHEDRAFT_1018597 [Bipolaris maydis C5]KAJ5031271.1 hypothetical protein J3E73DRAFT_265958 [Bipolaris maydis]ENI03719.1 hypothetical protein COCC4DRAFT_82396 [Bipolaris maydis ATCC 48331]KAJ5052971.1 hypothetical protein J3E74DRAFT_387353 [Bipolaris maydis]KAJ5060675.1 hypothetical protein J3E74DRAFT_346037 [Bipolaris maydis]
MPATPTHDPEPNSFASPATLNLNPIPFKDYLHIIAFTATITLSVSVSASQGFATGGNFFGIALGNANDTTTNVAIQQIGDSATWLSRSAALSAFSLMLTLALQLLMTSPSVVQKLLQNDVLIVLVFGFASWLAFLLQGASLATMGQALKGINHASGTMIQWCLLATGLPALLLWVLTLFSSGEGLFKIINGRRNAV